MNSARLALRILQNRAGLVPRPSWCTYLVRPRSAQDPMMTPTEVGAVFNRLGRLDGVVLAGPDPLLRVDLDEVVEAILENGRPGFLGLHLDGQEPERSEALVRGLSEARGLRVAVELPATPAREAPLDAHRRFVKAFQTLELLAAVARERRFVVAAVRGLDATPDGDELVRVRRSLAAIGVEVFAVPAPRGPDEEAPAEEVQLATSLLARSEQGAGWVSAESSRGFEPGRARAAERWLLETVAARRGRSKARCAALRSHIRLAPDGTVLTCEHRADVVGDMRRAEIADLWFGPEAERARAAVDGCAGCTSWTERLPGAIYRGELSRAAPPKREAAARVRTAAAG